MRKSQLIYQSFKQLFISLCISLLAIQAHAETNDQFGRLFSKPNERSNLNVLRQNQKLKTITQQEKQQLEAIVNAEPAELPDPIALQGYVIRNDGTKNTLWINNKAVQEDSTVNNVKIGRLNQRGFSKNGTSTEGVDVRISANGKRIRLKAGQMYEPENNKIYEMQVVEKAKRLNLERSGIIGDDGSRNSLDNNQE
jgi:hypothetical protein